MTNFVLGQKPRPPIDYATKFILLLHSVRCRWWDDQRAAPPPPAPPRVASPYLDIHDAADYCRLSVQTLKNNGRYITRVPGTRRWLTTRDALDRFLSTRRRRRRP